MEFFLGAEAVWLFPLVPQWLTIVVILFKTKCLSSGCAWKTNIEELLFLRHQHQ